MTIEKEIKDYIAKNILFSSHGFPYSDKTSFLEESIVDSQGVMDLVLYIEEKFGVKVEDNEITPENFDSVARLADYVRRKNSL
jgi:acyl carrier protein